MIVPGRVVRINPKPVHRAKGIREDGAVSALCSPRRTINLKAATWTNRDVAVTCKKCLVLMTMAERKALQSKPGVEQ